MDRLPKDLPYVPGSGSYGINDELWSDCIAGDFNGDGIDEILTGWVSTDGYLHLEMSCATRLKPTYNWEWSQHLLLSSSWTSSGPIRLLAVNLDSTFRKEIVVCAPTGSALRIVPYYMDDQGLNLIQGTAALVSSGSPYDIAAGDLNSDGRDELFQVYHDNTGPAAPYMTVVKYKYDPVNKIFNWNGSNSVNTTSGEWANWKRLKITTGDFRNLGYDEVVVSLTLTSGNSGRQVFNYITTAGTFLGWWDPPGSSPAGWTWGDGWESDAVASDLNPQKNDGEELIVAGPGEVAVLEIQFFFRTVLLRWRECQDALPEHRCPGDLREEALSCRR